MAVDKSGMTTDLGLEKFIGNITALISPGSLPMKR